VQSTVRVASSKTVWENWISRPAHDSLCSRGAMRGRRRDTRPNSASAARKNAATDCWLRSRHSETAAAVTCVKKRGTQASAEAKRARGSKPVMIGRWRQNGGQSMGRRERQTRKPRPNDGSCC
jgi:hypothetical protein